MSVARTWISRTFLAALAAAVLAVAGILGHGFLTTGRTIFGLLTENKELKHAISSLTAEDQIGYAKVIAQTERDGKVYTRMLFVETDRDDPSKRILQREYEIEGDVVYFDALVVKFGDQYVMDGQGRALYLWRRIYGETMSPASGYAIEQEGSEPRRYADLCAKLRLTDRRMFWSEIWNLSDDPYRLSSVGIEAIYGNVVYKKVRPGLIYVFKISNTGHLHPETVPAL